MRQFSSITVKHLQLNCYQRADKSVLLDHGLLNCHIVKLFIPPFIMSICLFETFPGNYRFKRETSCTSFDRWIRTGSKESTTEELVFSPEVTSRYMGALCLFLLKINILAVETV